MMKLILTGAPPSKNAESVGTEMVAPLWAEPVPEQAESEALERAPEVMRTKTAEWKRREITASQAGVSGGKFERQQDQSDG